MISRKSHSNNIRENVCVKASVQITNNMSVLTQSKTSISTELNFDAQIPLGQIAEFFILQTKTNITSGKRDQTYDNK